MLNWKCSNASGTARHCFKIINSTAVIIATLMPFQAMPAEVDFQDTSPLPKVSGTQQNQLQAFKAVYKAYRNGTERGHALMQLEKLDQHYKLYYESNVSMFFLSDKRFETSLFKFSDGQYQQLEYHYVREGTGPDKFLDLAFDSQNKKVDKDSKDGSGEFNWQGEWDNQLYRFDLQRKIKEGITDISYDLINYRGQLKTYGFEVVGQEVLELPFGKLNTIKVRTIRASKKRETFSWFAPDLNFQLVRLQQFKKGKEQGDIQLSEYTLL